ncbi:T9SS type A sorting domain-containing protein [Polaribacter glomeratus]|nr:T9SS type A sorting domain-containing protein [Polaribacter glomeratus]
MKTNLFFIFLMGFFIKSINSQNPNWTVNASSYQYSMTFTSFLNVNGATLTNTNDAVAAFVDGEIRGVSKVQFVQSANKYVSFLTVFANTNNEIINFKIYNSNSNTVVNTDTSEIFKIDGNFGGISQSYSIASPKLSEIAQITSFRFDGITAVSVNISSDKISIILPNNSDVSSLIPVFESSAKSKVFVNEVVQTSGKDLQNFINKVEYKVLSEDESTLKEYLVSVSEAFNNNPTSTTISTTNNLFTNLVPVNVEVAFSKAVSGFKKADIVLENAVVASFSTTNSQSYQLTLVPKSQGFFSITIPANIAVDANSNQNEISNTLEFVFDLSKPIITAISLDKNESSTWFLITFNEEVLNVDSADFELVGLASTDLEIAEITAISNAQYKIQLANLNTKIGVISLQTTASNNIRDKSNNALVNATFEAYFLNNEVLTVNDVTLEKNISIFPNPAKNNINIILDKGEVNQIILYDLSGKKIVEKHIRQQKMILDIKKVKTGIYFLSIVSDQGNFMKKIIIN